VVAQQADRRRMTPNFIAPDAGRLEKIILKLVDGEWRIIDYR
jgi:hypothetical protein